MTLKRNISLCFLLLTIVTAHGQQDVAENLLWSNVHITKNLSPNFSAKVKLSYYNTMPMMSPRFIDAGFTHQTTKHLSIGLYYRFVNTFTTSQQRFYFETSCKKLKIDALGISLGARFRLQHRLSELSDATTVSTYQMRPRFSIDKRLTNRLKAYSSIESFYSNGGKGTSYNYDRLRFDVGLNYKVPNTKHQVRLFYRHQADIDEEEVLAMLNIGYRFNF